MRKRNSFRESSESSDSQSSYVRPYAFFRPSAASFLPIPALIAIIALLYAIVPPSVFYDPGWLISITNTLFVAVICFAVAYIAMRNYVATGRIQILLLGCGVLIFGIGGIIAGFVRGLPDGANLNVTIYNTGALIGALFHFIAALILISGVWPETGSKQKIVWLAAGYLGIFTFMGLLTFASFRGMIPPFFIQGAGPTLLRQEILGAADVLFAFSFLVFIATYVRNKEVFLYWYSLALALTSISLTAFFIQHSVGSPVGWTGRISQYLGGVYFLISLRTAVRSAEARKTSFDNIITASLSPAEEKFRALAENSPDVIDRFDRERRHIYVNAAGLRLYGKPAGSIIGKTNEQTGLPEPYCSRWKERIQNVFETGQALEVEDYFPAADGSKFYQSRCVPEFGPDGPVANVLVVSRDLTERKRAEEALKDSERRYHSLFENMSEGFAYCKMQYDTQNRPVDFIYLDVNSSFMALTGLKDVVGKKVTDAIPQIKEAHPELFDIYGRVALTGRPERFEIEFKPLGMWLSISVYSVEREFFVAVFDDITERKKAEKELNRSARRFELLARTAGELLQSSEPQKIVDSLCRRVLEHLDCHAFFNYLVDEQAGRLHLNAWAGVPEEEARKIEWLDFGEAICGCAARDGCRIVAEKIPSTPDERTILVRAFGIKAYACHPILGSAGKVIGTLSFGTCSRETFSEDDLALMKAVTDQVAVAMIRMKDEQALRQAHDELEQHVRERTAQLAGANEELEQEIKERWLAEQDLRKSEERFRTSVETLLDGFAVFSAVTDASGRIADFRYEYINEAGCRLNQRTREEQTGHTLLELLPAHKDTGLFNEYVRVVETGEPLAKSQIFYEDTYGKGRRIGRAFDFQAVKLGNGFAVVWRDVSDRKDAEEKILRLNRLYSVLSKVNEAIVRIHEPITLYEQVCRIVVDDGTFKMAWIGLVDSETRMVKPAVSYGDTGGYLEGIKISASDAADGRGPTGRAVFEGTYSICSDIEKDSRMLPWREKALSRGFRSSAAFPLRSAGSVIGALMIYSDKPQFFSDQEISLFSSLTGDISFAIDSMANEKRRREAEDALRKSADEIADLYNNAPCGYHSLDRDGFFVRMNDTELRWLGYGRQEVVGKIKFSDILTPKSLEAFRQTFPVFKERGEIRDLEYEFIRKDRTILPVLLNASAIRDSAGKFIMSRSTVYDITERRETERRMALTNELLKLYTRKFSRKEYLDVAVELIRDWIGCRHTGVRIADPDGNIPYESCVGYNPDFLSSESNLSVKDDHCICTRIVVGSPGSSEADFMTRSGSYYCNHTTEFLERLTEKQKTQYRGVCMRQGFTSLAVVPIRHRDAILGAIHIADERPGMVSVKNVEFIEQLAFIIGEALFRFRVEEDLVRQREELARINEQLRNLSAHVDAVREGERTSIAREIHDELGQVLTAIKMDVSWLRNHLPKTQGKLSEKAKETLQIIDAAIQSVKRISLELRPGVLDDIGLPAAIEWATKDFQKRTGVRCSVSISPENISVDRTRSTALFRILQESLTNITRHAEASQVTVNLQEKDRSIMFTVTDNGKGIRKEQLSAPHAFGLIGMRERVQFLGGKVTITGAPKRGTTVAVVLPLDPGKRAATSIPDKAQ